LSPDQFGPVVVENSQQLLVVDVPERPAGLVLAEKPEVGEQLAEPHIRGQFAQLD
jgi:hypothetical protein